MVLAGTQQFAQRSPGRSASSIETISVNDAAMRAWTARRGHAAGLRRKDCPDSPGSRNRGSETEVVAATTRCECDDT